MSNKMKTVVEVSPAKTHDLWHGGKFDIAPSGNPTYFLCQFLDKTHYDEETKTFFSWCKHFRRPEDGSSCTMDCDQYGRCETCGGFSAVRCSECDIPRP